MSVSKEDGSLRALVVEDDGDTARLLKRILERRFPIRADVAADTSTARQKMSGERFDIITLDYMLPDGRGLDFLQEITSLDDHPRVIMVTGHGDEETAARSFTRQASGYVVKDLRLPDTLSEAVDKAITEIDLKQAQEALRSSEEHFRSLIENALDIVAVIERDGTITYASPSVRRALGYEPDGLVETGVFVLCHPEDVPAFKDALAASFLDRGSAVSVEFRLKHSNGTWHFFECEAQQLPDNTEREGVVINARDVTRRKHAEETLKAYQDHLERLVEQRTAELRNTNRQLETEVEERTRAQEELKERAERLRHFLTVASHELRHPVSVVKGYTTMLSGYMDKMSKEELPPILDAIDASTNRLTSYVDDLLDVSRIENGRFEIQRQETDPRALIATAIEELRVRGCETEFAERVSGDVGVVRIDHQKVSKLLIILLDNAIKFSSDGSLIEIEVVPDTGGTRFSVLDRGIGVPDELKEKIFGRFYQVEDVQHHSKPGLGLGLYIAREIARAHGGDVWCEPRDGGGSAFHFTVQ
jgi:PAS domain S-box-containing protein